MARRGDDAEEVRETAQCRFSSESDISVSLIACTYSAMKTFPACIENSVGGKWAHKRPKLALSITLNILYTITISISMAAASPACNRTAAGDISRAAS